MKDIQVFKQDGKEIRTVTIQGEPWFVARDVADALGYTWSGSRISHVPPEWRGMTSVVTPSGTQEMAVISEQGLYYFLGRSDKPAALPFQKWVAGEVLPTIRKTGKYELDKERAKSRDVRNLFTEVLRNHGCDAPIHYIKITGTMKKNAGIPGNKPKAKMDRTDLLKVTAAETIAAINLEKLKADGYDECKVVCQESARQVEIATSVTRIAVISQEN